MGLLDEAFAAAGMSGVGESFDSQVAGGANVDLAGKSLGILDGLGLDQSSLTDQAIQALGQTDWTAMARTHGEGYAQNTAKGVASGYGARFTGSGPQGYANNIGGGSSSGSGGGGSTFQSPTTSSPYSHQNQVNSMGGGGGYAYGGPSSQQSKGYTVPNGQQNNDSSLGRLGSILNLASNIGQSAMLSGMSGQQGGVGYNLPSFSQTPGITTNQQDQSSFSGMLSQPQQQPIQNQQVQPIQQQVQDSMEAFSMGGGKSAANPLFGQGIGNAASSGGSSFGAMAPSQASPQMMQQSANRSVSPLGSLQNVSEAPVSPIQAAGVGEQPMSPNLAPGVSVSPQGNLVNAQGQNVTASGQPSPTPVKAEGVGEGQSEWATIEDPDTGTPIKVKKTLNRPSGNKLDQIINGVDNEEEIKTGPKTELSEAQKLDERLKDKGISPTIDFNTGASKEDIQQETSAMHKGSVNQLITMGGQISGWLGLTDQKEKDVVQRSLRRDKEAARKLFKGTDDEFESAYSRGEILVYMAGPMKGQVIVKGGSKLLQKLAPSALKSKTAKGARAAAYTAATGTTEGGFYGATQYSRNSDELKENLKQGIKWGVGGRAAGGLAGKYPAEAIGAGIGYALGDKEGAIAGAIGGRLLRKSGFGFKSPTKGMLKEKIEEIASADNVTSGDKVAKAARREDILMTPGERAPTSKTLTKAEKGMTPSKEGVNIGSEFEQSRRSTIAGKLQDAINSVLPKGRTSKQTLNAAKRMYNRLTTRKMSAGATKELTGDESVQAFVKEANAKGASKAGRYSNDQAGKYIETEKYLNRKLQRGQNLIGEEKEAAEKIRAVLNGEFSSYRVANKTYQQFATQRDLQTKLRQIQKQGPATEKEISNAFFGNREATNEVISKVRRAGGNIRTLANLSRITDNLAASSFSKALNKSTNVITDFNIAHAIGVLPSAVKKIFTFHKDKLAVKMLTDPKYANRIEEIAKMPPQKQAIEIAKFLDDMTGGDLQKYGLTKSAIEKIKFLSKKASTIGAAAIGVGEGSGPPTAPGQLGKLDEIGSKVDVSLAPTKQTLKPTPLVKPVQKTNVSTKREQGSNLYTDESQRKLPKGTVVKREGDTISFSDEGLTKEAKEAALKNAVSPKAKNILKKIMTKSKAEIATAWKDPTIQKQILDAVREEKGYQAAVRLKQEMDKAIGPDTGVAGALKAKMGIKPEKELKTQAKREVVRQLPQKPQSNDKAALMEYKKKLDIAYQKRFAELKRQSRRQIIQRPQKQDRNSNIRRQLLMLLIQYLTKRSQGLTGNKAQAAGLILAGLNNKLS